MGMMRWGQGTKNRDIALRAQYFRALWRKRDRNY